MTRLLYADDVTYFAGTTRLLYADDLTFSFRKVFHLLPSSPCLFLTDLHDQSDPRLIH